MEITREISNPGLISRIRNIILRPRAEWDAIAAESTTPRTLYLHYIMPLAAIGPICSIIGNSLVGISIPFFGTWRVPLGSSIGSAVLDYVLMLIGVYVIALIINALAPTFGGTKDRVQALKVSAYSMTPAWLIAVVALYPAIGLVKLLGLYGLFLLYVGLPPLMRSSPEKRFGYLAVTIIAMIAVFIVIGIIAGLLIGGPTLHGVNP